MHICVRSAFLLERNFVFFFLVACILPKFFFMESSVYPVTVFSLYARVEGLSYLYTQAAQTLNVITLVCNIMLLVIVLQFLMLGALVNLAYLSLHCFSVSVFLEAIRAKVNTCKDKFFNRSVLVP